MKKNVLFFLFILHITAGFSQQAIDVTEQTIKIGARKSEEMYFGFAAGDQLIFNFAETDKKELKEIEIIEYPSASKFADFKTAQIDHKVLQVSKTGVYQFRFHNTALTGRVCRIHIQRIPASEATLHFNTNVSWVNRQDTSWNSYTRDELVGYDTLYEQVTKKELVKTEQVEELIMDKPQRVHSATNENGNRTSLFFTLPQAEIGTYKTKKVIAWAYWVGVGEEANQAWKQNMKVMGTLVKSTAKMFTSPLGALAIGAIADLAVPHLGEDVAYCVTDQMNRDLFLARKAYRIYDEGKGVAGFRKFTQEAFCRGTWFICLSNDNTMQGIDATIKVVTIIETNYYEDRVYREQKITPRYEKKIHREPVISLERVPVTGS
jgi:hypothetical protein